MSHLPGVSGTSAGPITEGFWDAARISLVGEQLGNSGASCRVISGPLSRQCLSPQERAPWLHAARLERLAEGPAADGLVDPHSVPVVGHPGIEVFEEDLSHELAPTVYAGLGEDALQMLLNG